MSIEDYTQEFNCTNCFYSQNSKEDEPAYGRTKDGVETWSEEVFNSSVVCYAEPEPQIISRQCVGDGNFSPDIIAEPEFHMCGRGRWWKDRKWVCWIDVEG